MQRLSAQLSGKLVVWFIYVGNDLYENLHPNHLHYRMPFVRRVPPDGKWHIVTHHVSRDKWPLPQGKRDFRRELVELCAPTCMAERAYSACEFLIREGSNICSQADARLAIMTIPSRHMLSPTGLEILASYGLDVDVDRPDRRISTICRNLGVPFVPSKEVLKASDYRRYDPHWNEDGHRRIAKLLSSIHEDFKRQRLIVRML